MTCSEIQKALSAYVDRELPVWEKTAVSAHVDACTACQTEVHSLVEIKRRLRTVALPSLPAEIRQAIQAETVLKSFEWPAWMTVRWWFPPMAMAAALGGWLMLRWAQHLAPNPPPPLPMAQSPAHPKTVGDLAETEKHRKEKG